MYSIMKNQNQGVKINENEIYKDLLIFRDLEKYSRGREFLNN